MATLRIPLDREAAEQSGTLTLDGEQYRLRVRWQEASLGWYADLFTLDEFLETLDGYAMEARVETMREAE